MKSITQSILETLTTHNDRDLDVNGSTLQGYLNASPEDLTKVFGKPLGSSDKVTMEWNLVIDGEVITIYNWKTDELGEWNIGGYGRTAVDILERYLRLKHIPHSISYA